MPSGSPLTHSTLQYSGADAILQSTNHPAFCLNREGNFLFFNTAFGSMLWHLYGIPAFTVTSWQNLAIPEGDKALMQKGMDAAWKKNTQSRELEVGLTDRKKSWYAFEFSPTSVEEDIVTSVSVFARDITRQVEERNALEEARDSAQGDAKAMSAFLSTMSHEIRTPMNAILGLTELLLQKRLDDNTLDNLRAIRFSASNLLTILNDILDHSKIEAGRLTLDIESFDFLQVLDELNRNVSVSAKAKNLSYEVSMSGTLPRFLKGDSVRLTQILFNLLSNSVKFTQTGKVKLTLDVVKESQTDIVLEFKVSDTGIGIPKDKLQTIFNRFTQLKTPGKFKNQGTGLGLSITRRLVEMQHGEIWVESAVGKGSVFTFTLPFLKTQHAPNTSARPDELPGKDFFGGMKVLLVEDNKINQMLARQILQDWEVEVVVANDGFEAIALLQRYRFEVILLDLQMPEIDGFEVARYVRKVLKSPANKIPIVALTADAFHETRELTLKAGMNDFIAKPYQQRDLFRVLRRFSEVPQDVVEEQPSVSITEETGQKINFEFVRSKFGKDQDTFRYILEVFRNEIGEEIRSIRPFFIANEMSKATKVVHKLVSSFTAMGMPDTAMTLSIMERMLKQNAEVGELLEKLGEVEHSYRLAIQEVEPILASLNN